MNKNEEAVQNMMFFLRPQDSNAILARLAAAEKLAEALTDILPDSDVDGETDCCMWCGREFDKGEHLCASDDCAGHKARAALTEWEQK